MTVTLKLCVGILLWLAAVQADVSHLGYGRYKGERLRLQRLESEPTPYPAAGYRPNREFGLPHEQPLFPLGNQHGNRPFGSSGFNNLGEAQRPQLTYGSPQAEPRYRSQKFNNVEDEPQEQVFVIKYHQRQPVQTGQNSFDRPQQPQNTNGGFNFAGDQQYDLEEQFPISDQQPQKGFNNLAEPQQPDLVYGAPSNQEQEAQSARLRQQLFARLQQTPRSVRIQRQRQPQVESQRYRQSPQQQLFVNAPQTPLHSAPFSQQHLQQFQAESKTSRLIARKPARLSDNREETEVESDVKTAETEEIETTTQAEGKKTVTQKVPAAGGVTPVVPNTNGVVSYYPASAVGFVQPLNAAAYLAAANYQTLQPFSGPYMVGAPYLQQQYVVGAAPAAQLQAW